MAIGTTSAYDPTTGEWRETQFEYTPVDPQEDLMRRAFEQSQAAFNPPPPQPQGPTPYWENPATYYPRQQQIDQIEQAKAATAAAYKYIAFRGYQQDLKEGKSAADAFAKWGPMLVQDVSLAPAMKALQPSPTWAYNQQTRAYEPSGGGGTGIRPIFNPHPELQTEGVVPAGGGVPTYVRDVKGGIHFPPAGAAAKIDPFVKADYDRLADDYERASKVYGDAGSSEADRKGAIQQMATAQRGMEMIRKRLGQVVGTALPLTQPAATPTPMTPSKEVIRLTKDGKKAVFDAVTKQFIRYAE